MRIKRFRGRGVHGYLDFDIDFFDDCTFLTGINGSGKTTVVRSIAALLSPSLVALAHTEHTELEIALEHDGEPITIRSQRTSTDLVLSTSISDGDLSIPLRVVSDDPDESSMDRIDAVAAYYRALEKAADPHSVIQVLRKLPTPMLLGLERRAEAFGESRPRPRYPSRYPDYRQLLFRNSFLGSVTEAASLAERQYYAIQDQQDKLTESLRHSLILAALEYEPLSKINRLQDVGQSWQSANQVASQKHKVVTALEQLGLSKDELNRTLGPFFDTLERLIKEIPKDLELEEALQRAFHEKNNQTALFEWFASWPQLGRIIEISRHVGTFIEHSNRLNDPVNQYLSIVNEFLADSGKALQFNRKDGLEVVVDGTKRIPITSLSSGESQIVVIITHLAFNSAAEAANIFIVDEPELSLHIKWQELFVNSIRKANPQIQLILASHSPSIILDDIEHCVDLRRTGHA